MEKKDKKGKKIWRMKRKRKKIKRKRKKKKQQTSEEEDEVAIVGGVQRQAFELVLT